MYSIASSPGLSSCTSIYNADLVTLILAFRVNWIRFLSIEKQTKRSKIQLAVCLHSQGFDTLMFFSLSIIKICVKIKAHELWTFSPLWVLSICVPQLRLTIYCCLHHKNEVNNPFIYITCCFCKLFRHDFSLNVERVIR